MPKQITTQEFIARAQKTHNNFYDYSQTVYTKMHAKVKIIDPEFGEFWQTPMGHLQKQGHPIRGKQKAAPDGELRDAVTATWTHVIGEVTETFIMHDKDHILDLMLDHTQMLYKVVGASLQVPRKMGVLGEHEYVVSQTQHISPRKPVVH